MSKSVAWAYGLAGAIVAVAVIVVAGSTVGLTEGADAPESAAILSTDTPPGALGAGLVSSEVVTTASGEQVEYVYVDQPASGDHRDRSRSMAGSTGTLSHGPGRRPQGTTVRIPWR